MIKNFDTNHDGKVSKEELLAGVERDFVGKPADALPAWWKDNIAILFHSALNKPMAVVFYLYLRLFIILLLI